MIASPLAMWALLGVHRRPPGESLADVLLHLDAAIVLALEADEFTDEISPTPP